MELIENIIENNDVLEIDELLQETPVGWSSICLDQTIDYYTECNFINVNEYQQKKDEF